MKIEIIKYNDMPSFGGFCAGSVKNKEPIILVNTEMIFKDGSLVYDNGEEVILNSEEKKRCLIETLMHEFGHALEEQFETDFDEDWIERTTETYREEEL